MKILSKILIFLGLKRKSRKYTSEDIFSDSTFKQIKAMKAALFRLDSCIKDIVSNSFFYELNDSLIENYSVLCKEVLDDFDIDASKLAQEYANTDDIERKKEIHRIFIGAYSILNAGNEFKKNR